MLFANFPLNMLIYFICCQTPLILCLAGIDQGEKFQRSAIHGQIIGGPFSLISTEGQVVNEKNLLGNWVLLYFGYTSSPDVGPAEVQKMAKAIDILGSALQLPQIVFYPFAFSVQLLNYCHRLLIEKNQNRISRCFPFLLQLILSGTHLLNFVLISVVSPCLLGIPV